MYFTKKSVMVVLVIIVSIFVALFTFEGNMLTGAAIVDQDLAVQIDVTTCIDLDTAGATYNVLNHVSTFLGCFTVKAHHLTLDCHGFNITHGAGPAVNDSAGFDNITVKDCYTTPAAGLDNTNVISLYFNNAENSTIVNNSIKTSASNSHGIVLESSNNNLVGYNNITYAAASGIILNGSSNANIMVNNTLNSTYVRANDPSQAQHINDSATGTNTLIYNSSLGSVQWNSTDLTINYSIPTFTSGGGPRIIFIEKNLVGLRDDFYIGNLNASAQIKIKGLASTQFGDHQHMYKAGVRCDNQSLANPTFRCNISYDASNGTVTANVTSFSNFTIDTAAPTVTFTLPTSNGNYSAGVEIVFEATVNDDFGVQNVTFVFGNGSFPFNITPQNISGTWSTTISIARFGDGNHNVTVHTNDTVGNRNDSQYINITVDRSSPSVIFTNPAAGSSVSGMESFRALVDDNFTDIIGVIFQFSNGTTPFNRTASNTSGSWNVSVDTTGIPEGGLTVTAFANDTLGNKNNTQTLSVEIDNIAQTNAGGSSSSGSSSSSTSAPSAPTRTETSAPSEPSRVETASASEAVRAFESRLSFLSISPIGERAVTTYTSEQSYRVSITNNLDKKLVLTAALKEQQEIRLENEDNVKKRLKEEQLLRGEIDEAALEKELNTINLLESVKILQVYKTKLSHLLPSSLVGATATPLVPTGKHIEANLLKNLLLNAEELQNIEVNPGETLEKEIKIRRGLNFDQKPPQIIFSSGGESVLVKDLENHEKLVIGTAVDVDSESKRLDFYIVIPPQPQQGKEIFTVEMNINAKKAKTASSMPLKVSFPFLFSGEYQTIFTELYGPYNVNLQHGALLAVQYNASAILGEYEVVGKVYRRGTELIAENRFEIKQ